MNLLKEKLITPKFDLVFKKVYGSENDNIPMKVFLKEVLNLKPKKIEVLNSEVVGMPYKDKKILVDLIVELDNKEKVVIEVNTEVDKPMYDRNLFYICRIIGKNLEPGEFYDKLGKHILVNLNFKGKHARPITKYNIVDKKTGEIYSKKLEIINIDIPYYSKKCYTNREDVSKLSKLEKFLGMFDIEDNKLAIKLSEGDRDMEDIYKKIKECNLDDEIIGAYDAEWHRSEIERLGMLRATKEGHRKGYTEGKKLGKKEGIKEGIKEGNINVAKSLLKEGVDIDIISRATNLSIQDIKKLI